MPVRILLTVDAVPGKGDELAEAYRVRCAKVMKEPGCEQFEAFRSVSNPDRFTVLERWADQKALDVHAQLNVVSTEGVKGLRGATQREDYVYNRTR